MKAYLKFINDFMKKIGNIYEFELKKKKTR